MIDRTSLRSVETCATAAPGPAINVWPRVVTVDGAGGFDD